MICRHGGLTFVRHNDLRDTTAELLSNVCTNVAIEPPLQSLSGEELTPRSANCQDDARADIPACGNVPQFFDARVFPQVFHPNAQSYRNVSSIGVMRCRRRGSMVTVSVRWSLHPLLHWCLPQLGAWGGKPSHFIAGLLSSFPNVVLCSTLAWIRCTLSFSLLRSATMCIRGSRSL